MAYDKVTLEAMQRDFAQYIGMQIKLRRTEMRLTLREVSETTGITEAKLSQLERGLADVRISTIARLRSALALDIEIKGLGRTLN